MTTGSRGVLNPSSPLAPERRSGDDEGVYLGCSMDRTMIKRVEGLEAESEEPEECRVSESAADNDVGLLEG